MLVYISRNVIRGNFQMNNVPADVSLCNLKYDMTDLFEVHEAVIEEPEIEGLV